MYKETYDGTLGICVGICRALMSTHTLGESARNARSVLDSMPWVDRKSRGEILAEADVLTRSLMMERRDAYASRISHGFDGVMKAFNRAYKRRWVATKKRHVVARMDVNRRKAEPIVFYLVSKHQKPQEAHAGIQGTVLIDRFWRSALGGDSGSVLSPERAAVLRGVEAYVKSNSPTTVQRAMEGPTWLITRVNCRHYLIPLPTRAVLDMGVRELNEAYQKRPSGIRRPLTDPQRYAEYLDLKGAIRRRCSGIVRLASRARF